MSSSNSYHRTLIYRNNFSRSQGKTNNRIKMWVNNTNSWFKKNTAVTHMKWFLKHSCREIKL